MEKEFPVVDASEINEASLAVRRIISSMLSAAVAASPSESQSPSTSSLSHNLNILAQSEADLTSSLSLLQSLDFLRDRQSWELLSEMYTFYLTTQARSQSLRSVFAKKTQLLFRSPHASNTALAQLISQIDKHSSSLKELFPSSDRLSLFLFITERLLDQSDSSATSSPQLSSREMFSICVVLATTDSNNLNEYLEGLSVILTSSYCESTSTRLKAHNNERVDCISLLILETLQRVSCDPSTSVSSSSKQLDSTLTSPLALLQSFLRSLFKHSLLLPSTSDDQLPVQQLPASSQATSFSRKDAIRAQQFLTRFSIDVSLQTFSAEFSIAAAILCSLLDILKQHIERSLPLQTNAFLVDISKNILKSSYADSSTITSLASDMTATLEVFNPKTNRKKAIQTDFVCGVCGESNPTTVMLRLKQNEDELVICSDCSDISDLSKPKQITAITNAMQLIKALPQALETGVSYYFTHVYSATLNANFLSSSRWRNITNEERKFIHEKAPEEFGSSGCGLEVDFMDFMYRLKQLVKYDLAERLSFLLKYICALTDDNSASIRNKSLCILREVGVFNRSEMFEQYLTVRRLDSSVNVRLTCMRILEGLYTGSGGGEQGAINESEVQLTARKDRYFKLILDRFNDKEASVRGQVMSFIANHVEKLAEDKSLRLVIIRQLVARLIKDTTAFQSAALDILAKIYFPRSEGAATAVKTKKAARNPARKSTANFMDVEKSGHPRRQSSAWQLKNKEEEKTLEGIIELQKCFELPSDTMQRVFSHFLAQSGDVQFLSRLQQVSLRILEERIADAAERQHVLAVIETLSRMRVSEEMCQELALFLQHFETLFAERSTIPLKEKLRRAELNLCLITLLDVFSNLFSRNLIKPTTPTKIIIQRLESLMLAMIGKEGNIFVLKKLVEVSAHCVNYVSQNIQPILEVFGQRFSYLRSLQDEEGLEERLARGSDELLVFRITMSVYIMSIYAYHFFHGAFRALSVTMKDLVALLMFFLSMPNEKVQAASFENIALLWEKEQALIFSCQEILAELITDRNTSHKLLTTVYTIFHGYILKHVAIIEQKASRVTTVKIKSALWTTNDEEEAESDFEQISSVIRDLTLSSYERCLASPHLQLRQAVLRLLSLLVKQNLLFFQQIGVSLIPLLCDTDILTRTLVNAAIFDQSLLSIEPIGQCLKTGLRRSAGFIDVHYECFTVTETSLADVNKIVSFFERLACVLRGKAAGQQQPMLVTKMIEVVQEIQEYSYDDHEVAYFICQIAISLNEISQAEITKLLIGFKQIADRLFHDVMRQLKCGGGGKDEPDEVQSGLTENGFIKANVLLMVLTTAHILMLQSKSLPGQSSLKYQQLDAATVELDEEELEQFATAHGKVWRKAEDSEMTRFILEQMNELFLQEMREFDCSDEEQVKRLRKKLKHLFYDQVEVDVRSIISLDAGVTRKHAMRAEQQFSDNRVQRVRPPPQVAKSMRNAANKAHRNKRLSMSCNVSKKSHERNKTASYKDADSSFEITEVTATKRNLKRTVDVHTTAMNLRKRNQDKPKVVECDNDSSGDEEAHEVVRVVAKKR